MPELFLLCLYECLSNTRRKRALVGQKTKEGAIMKAILTKVLGYTAARPTRIKAYAEGGNSLISSWDDCTPNGEDDRRAHLNAAIRLAKKMQWSTDLIGGGTPEGYCFVFADSEIRTRRAS
jgi:hypothetical protein